MSQLRTCIDSVKKMLIGDQAVDNPLRTTQCEIEHFTKHYGECDPYRTLELGNITHIIRDAIPELVGTRLLARSGQADAHDFEAAYVAMCCQLDNKKIIFHKSGLDDGQLYTTPTLDNGCEETMRLVDAQIDKTLNPDVTVTNIVPAGERAAVIPARG